MQQFQPFYLCMKQIVREDENRYKGIDKMRIWVKVFDHNTHMLNSETIEDYTEETRTHKVFQALEEACNRMDLGKPIWLDSNVKEFKHLAKTRFYQDNFIEEIEFQYLELHVIEED